MSKQMIGCVSALTVLHTYRLQCRNNRANRRADSPSDFRSATNCTVNGSGSPGSRETAGIGALGTDCGIGLNAAGESAPFGSLMLGLIESHVRHAIA